MKDGKCSLCGPNNKYCMVNGGNAPEFCSTILYKEALDEAEKKYDEPENARFALESARQEKSGYTDVPGMPGKRMSVKPRIQEVIEFCHRMGYKRIGLAFCVGLQNEAMKVAKIFEAHDLEVVSVACKVGGLDKSRIGVADEEKLVPGSQETMCNPIGQAAVLNAAKTDFNVLLGLCVGHDSLFIKYTDAMCTVLAVKDRMLGHNPLAAVYNCDSYFKYLK